MVKKTKKNVYAVILAGGSGTRFWPVSRQLEPKQFLKVVGKRTLIQDTFWRIKPLVPAKNIFVLTNSKYFYEIKRQLGKYAFPDKNILLEPQAKNTAPSVGWAADVINQKDPNAVMLVLPSDHLILKPKIFHGVINRAVKIAEKGKLVTLGIVAKKPITGYGYIKINKNKKAEKHGFMVDKFIEKPSVKNAEKFIKAGNHFWNSGMFVWKAETLLDEIKNHIPSLYKKLPLLRKKDSFKKIWNSLVSVSIDYGILEKSRKVAMIPADIGWMDLGSWEALNSILKKDKSGNVVRADNINFDSKNMLVWGSDRLIATIGLKNLVIVDTQDATLVCRKDRTQDVRKIVDKLKKEKRQEHVLHKTAKRPWGSYTVLENRAGYKIKTVNILPGHRLSLQLHRKRAEHWVVVEGVAKVQKGSQVQYVHANESLYIPAKTKHRLTNSTDSPLRIVEVQTGPYLQEDDIVRFKDDYKR